MDRGRSLSAQRSVSVSRRNANALEESDETKAGEIAQSTDGEIGETLRSVLGNETTEVHMGGTHLKKDDVTKGRILAALFILMQKNKSVRHLTVEKVDITEPWLMKIIGAAIRSNNVVESFRLEDTNIGPEGANMLADSLSQNNSIRMLSFKGNSIGDSGTTSLTEALLKNTTISEINLEDNVLSDAGLSQLSRLLENRAMLKRMFIGKNMFTFDSNKHFDPVVKKMITATDSFSRALLKNNSLNLLSLSGNQMKLTYALAPILDALKFCSNLRMLDLSDSSISNRLILSLAEYCIAVRDQDRKLNLTDTGVEALREACSFRIAKHKTKILGVDYGGISNSEEITAQITFIVHLLARQDESLFPNSDTEEFALLDGRIVTIRLDEEGCIFEGEILYSHGDTLTFTPPDVPSRKLQKEESPNKSFSLPVNRVKLQGKYKMQVPAGCSLSKLIAIGSAGLNLVDYFLDLVVLGQLAFAGQWETFYFLLAVVALAVIYVCYSLWADGRILASLLHPFSLSIVLDAFNFVVRGQVPSAAIMIDTSQPMQGLAAIQRLKLTEALLEAAPQVLLQSFVALDSSEPGIILLSSIGISFFSIVGAITQSDRQKIGAWGNAVNKPWVSTLSFSVVFLAAFRSMEVLSNVATISLAMEALPTDDGGWFNIATFLGITLGSKLLLTWVYWRFNLSHLGEVISSVLIAPGTEKITYDWVKGTRRLPIWFYIAVQVMFDFGILGAMAFVPGSTARNGLVHFFATAVIVVGIKYSLLLVLWVLHNYVEGWFYKDRRHILTCGLLKKEAALKPQGSSRKIPLRDGRKMTVVGEAKEEFWEKLRRLSDPEESSANVVNPLNSEQKKNAPPGDDTSRNV